MKVRVNAPSHRFHGREGELLGPEPWFAEQGFAPLVAVKVGTGASSVTYIREEQVEEVEES